jgi:predicted ferric reductase
MLLSTGYRTHSYWKKLPLRWQRLDIQWLHNWTAYLALLLVLLHPLFLLLDAGSKFTWIDIVYPLGAPHQPLFVSFGYLAMLALITVVITTQKAIRRRLSFRLWKNIHLISYGTAMLFVVHGLMMDPLLKDRPVDWLDGEKFLCEACCCVLLLASVVRWRYHVKKAQEKERKNLLQ